MKFNISKLRYLGSDDFRVLSAIELGMKNHETVPLSVIESISHFQPSLVRKCLRELGRLKLLQKSPHGASGEESYKLGYGGYDFLAMKAFSSKKVLASVGDQLGVGKESDIIRAILPDNTLAAIKIHR